MNDFFAPHSPLSSHNVDDVLSINLKDNVHSEAAPPACPAIAACAGSDLSKCQPNQWTGVVQNIIRCLTADELKNLRLVGSKEVAHLDLADPSLTSHLQLRMDRASFFKADNRMPNDRVRKWLVNRRRLVIDDVKANICTNRVAHLMDNGYLDSVSELVVFDCRVHHDVISILAELPNLESLRLADHEDCREEGLEELESIVASVGRMSPSMKHLDVEFDSTVHGSRLSFLERLPRLARLRLRGFDLSDGINYMGGLGSLTSLHLCHGNFYSSPNNDVGEKDLLNLMGLTNLRQIHLEGFDSLSNVGLEPFCTASSSVERLVLKHCQELSERCLLSVGSMVNLRSVHIVNSACDDTVIFGAEGLHNLNSLSSLKSLSLFYVLEVDDLSNLTLLWGLDSLETLNIAVEEEINAEEFSILCDSILLTFASLRKLRIFSEDGMSHTFHRGTLEVEFATFNFGDLVYLD